MVASLYSSTDLSFLPTVSPEFIRDSQSTREYFMNFLKKLPEGTITQDNVQNYGEDAYLHTGMYTFQTGPEGNRQPVEARFSYMWRLIDGEWKIVHHHSSALPKQAATAEVEMNSEDMYPIAQVTAGHQNLLLGASMADPHWCCAGQLPSVERCPQGQGL
jgi:ketosteroid isomerase-like protein